MARTNMSLLKNVSAGGVNEQDQNYFGQSPDFTGVNRKMGKAPGAGTFTSLTAVAGLQNLGYYTLLTDGGVKVRLIVTDHPDGG